MIELVDLCVRFEGFRLKDVSLSVGEGDFFAIIGPTGAGKTVLLEAMAGLVPVESGRIIIAGRDVTHLPPEERCVGIVYQDYALFPHMTVRENILYGTRYRGKKAKTPEGRLARYIDLLGLRPLLSRRPEGLSGGEKQRVALARALAVDPAVLLLDEPFSALDPSIRQEVREEIARLHRASGLTIVLVTHDFSDVLALANKTAVIKDGRIVQAGEVEEVFHRPASGFVADFVGARNVFRARFDGDKAMVGHLAITLVSEPPVREGYIIVRPESIVLSAGPLASSMRNSFAGVVRGVSNHGALHHVAVGVNDLIFYVAVTEAGLMELDLAPGKPVYISFKASAVGVRPRRDLDET